MKGPCNPRSAGAARARTRHGAGHIRAAVLLALLGSASEADAGEWEIEPSLRLSETWTDNVTLAAREPDEEWITEIAPGLRVSGRGRRARLELAYRLQHLLHVHEPERDRTNQEVAADGDLELVRERLFLDGRATRSRDTGGPEVAVPTSNLIAPDQRDTVTTWSAGPRLQYPLGRFARVQARLRRDHVDFGSRAEGESESDLGTLGIASGPMFPDWGWALDFSRREETRDRTGELEEETRFESVRGELNWRVGATTQLFAAGGREDNEFETAEAGDPVDGDFWEAGVRWNPRRTVSLEAAAGERFFGDTARASLRLRGAALSLELDVSEDLLTTSQLQLERSAVLLQDDEGNLVVGPDGQPVTVSIDVPTVRDQVILQQRAGARLRWDHGHTRVTLALLATDREFQREGTSEDARQADLDWTWSRLRRTTIAAGLGLGEQQFAGDEREDETVSVRIEARRRLGADADLSLELEDFSRDSTEAGAEFDSVRATLALEMVF